MIYNFRLHFLCVDLAGKLDVSEMSKGVTGLSNKMLSNLMFPVSIIMNNNGEMAIYLCIQSYSYEADHINIV